MAAEKSIEVRVGALIVISLGILAAFILVMGGLSFQKTYSVYVDFNNPGGLQSGAPIRIAGVKVGKVAELEFMGGRVDEKTGRRSLVRAKLALEERVKQAIHDDADFYVTTQGVLGEQFLAIEPGSADKPPIAEGAVIKGIDPPRLDLFLAKGYELLETTMKALHNNRELISDLATNAAGLLKGLNGAVADNRERINRTLANLESLSNEANTLVAHSRTNYVDNPKLTHIIDTIDALSTQIQSDSAPLLKDARESLANLNRASRLVGGEQEQAQLRKTLDEVVQLAARANATAADAQAIVQHVRRGSGTVGALVMDEAIFDDVQEMVRDLKHNPWKFLWRQ